MARKQKKVVRAVPSKKRKTKADSPPTTRTLPPIVFAGPSVSREEIARFAPVAEVRRPIRRGDLKTIESNRLVAIIDGVFDAELSVSPREIRAAIARGVRIVGSSSMGALRAAEVHQMLGVGEVYRMYRHGEIERDDEVAVLLDNETGRSLTEPLVNIRFSVSQLVREGSLGAQDGDAILDAATNLHFHDRTYRNILRKSGLGKRADLDALVSALKSVDLKRQDALTLLERLSDLDTDARWEKAKNSGEGDDEEDDALDHVVAAKVVDADAPLTIWECGEPIELGLLLQFIALTGRFDAYARNAILRFLLGGGSIPVPRKKSRFSAMTSQDLLYKICEAWGWETDAEIQVTLKDLGVGADDLSERLGEEHLAQVKLLALYEQMPAALQKALRFELLGNNLALKREAMRVGALKRLAHVDAGEALTRDELAQARTALLGSALLSTEIDTWTKLLETNGFDDAAAMGVVELVAKARRRGVSLLESMDRAGSETGADIASSLVLPEAKYISGTTRSVSDSAALTIVRKVAESVGVTRIAQIGELGSFRGLHVASAYRPSKWSSTVGSGKAETQDGAMVGAVMEEVEKFCQDAFEPEETVRDSFENVSRSQKAIDPVRLALPYDSSYTRDRALQWTFMDDLVSREKILVPLAALKMDRLENDPYFSKRLSRKWFSTNGLASSLTTTEALLHALCELIERHAVKLAEQDLSNPGSMPGSTERLFIDLDTCPASTLRVCSSIRDAGYEIRVLDITSEITVPTFLARLVQPSSGLPNESLVSLYSEGACTHPSAEIAINRAILEAVQNVLQNISGAREDFAMHARSLGRHQRPRPAAVGGLAMLQPWVRKRPFDTGSRNASALEDVAFVVRRLTAAGLTNVLFRDLSVSAIAPAQVVRVLVPDLEDVNPLYTGPRARVTAVRDLMRQQIW